jgi:uncharacterized membrane protein
MIKDPRALALLSGISTALSTIVLKLTSFSHLWLVVLLQVIATFTVFIALSKEKASIIAPISGTTSNLVVVAFGALYLGEIVSPQALFGILLVVLGTILISSHKED